MICHVPDVKSHESMGICGNLYREYMGIHGNTWEYFFVVPYGGVMGVSQQQGNYHFSGVRMRTLRDMIYPGYGWTGNGGYSWDLVT